MPFGPDDILDPSSRINALLDAAEPRIARVFREAIIGLKGSLDLDTLEQLITYGQWEEALGLLQHAADALGAVSGTVFVTAGQSTAQLLASAGVARIVFDVSNKLAVQAMQANTLRLVTDFTDEQRRAVSRALVDGIARGDNPRQQARNFRDVVGLTERQSAAVSNYRNLLERAGASDFTASQQLESLTRELRDGRYDRTVQRAVRTSTPLTDQQVDLMVQRYAERYVKFRAEVIGRTEALTAVHEGSENTYAQAIAAGTIDAQDIERTWDSSHDMGVRLSHTILDGQTKGWGETWQGLDSELRYPGDPEAAASERVQCRCVLTTRLKRNRAA